MWFLKRQNSSGYNFTPPNVRPWCFSNVGININNTLTLHFIRKLFQVAW